MKNTRPPRIAICFFGITRSLTFTIKSIRENVLGPAQKVGESQIFAHFFLQREIYNPRSKERGDLNLQEHMLIQADWLRLEEPETCLQKYDFSFFKTYGDRWGDNYRSLRNLIHQLHSLKLVTEATKEFEPDIFVFSRPDLVYHDNLSPFIAKAIKAALRSESLALIPNWQSKHARLNDRFAICVGRDAAAAYGCRIDRLKAFCNASNMAPQPESLVKFVLDCDGIPISLIRARASRVRIDGKMVKEDFTPKRMKELREAFGRLLRLGRSPKPPSVENS